LHDNLTEPSGWECKKSLVLSKFFAYFAPSAVENPAPQSTPRAQSYFKRNLKPKILQTPAAELFK
jgi:hypothetical protein